MGCPSGTDCAKNAAKIAGKRKAPTQKSSANSFPSKVTRISRPVTTVIRNGKTVQR